MGALLLRRAAAGGRVAASGNEDLLPAPGRPLEGAAGGATHPHSLVRNKLRIHSAEGTWEDDGSANAVVDPFTRDGGRLPTACDGGGPWEC